MKYILYFGCLLTMLLKAGQENPLAFKQDRSKKFVDYRMLVPGASSSLALYNINRVLFLKGQLQNILEITPTGMPRSQGICKFQLGLFNNCQSKIMKHKSIAGISMIFAITSMCHIIRTDN